MHAPILRNGVQVAVAGPAVRIDPLLYSVTEAVIAAARQVSDRLGHAR